MKGSKRKFSVDDDEKQLRSTFAKPVKCIFCGKMMEWNDYLEFHECDQMNAWNALPMKARAVAVTKKGELNDFFIVDASGYAKGKK